MSRFNNFVLRYLNVWMALIVGGALGMCLFSLLVQAPQGLEDWLSAIGTMLAVIVSLYLANRPRKKGRLEIEKVTAIFHNHVNDADVEEDYRLVVSLDCRNVGGSDILIRNIEARIAHETITMFSLGESVDKYLIKVGEIKYLEPVICLNSLNSLGDDFKKHFDDEFEEVLLEDVIILTLVGGEKIKIPVNLIDRKVHENQIEIRIV